MASTPRWAAWAARLKKLATEPALRLRTYCLLAVPVALVPSVLLLGTVVVTLELAGVDVTRWLPPSGKASVAEFLGGVVFAPVGETFILTWMLTLLRSAGRPFFSAAVISACVWGAFHALFGALWFFGVVWSFFVFSCAYMAWRKVSFWHGYAAAAVPHALGNALALTADFVVSR